MTQSSKKYSEDFKIKAVWLVLEENMSITAASQASKVSRSSMSQWIEQYKDNWAHHKTLIQGNYMPQENGHDSNLETLKIRLANGEISIEEYKELRSILVEETFSAKQKQHAQSSTKNKKIPFESRRVSAGHISYRFLPNAFDFTGARKILYYITLGLSFLLLATIPALLLAMLFDGKQIVKFYYEYLFNIDGTLFAYLLGSIAYSKAGLKILSCAIYGAPAWTVLFYFRIRAYKKSPDIKKYNRVPICASFIILFEIIGVLSFITLDTISILLALISVLLCFYVFFQTANLKEINYATIEHLAIDE